MLPAHKFRVLVLVTRHRHRPLALLADTIGARKESNLKRTEGVSAPLFIHKAPRENYDISTYRLTADRSASELPRNIVVRHAWPCVGSTFHMVNCFRARLRLRCLTCVLQGHIRWSERNRTFIIAFRERGNCRYTTLQ